MIDLCVRACRVHVHNSSVAFLSSFSAGIRRSSWWWRRTLFNKLPCRRCTACSLNATDRTQRTSQGRHCQEVLDKWLQPTTPPVVTACDFDKDIRSKSAGHLTRPAAGTQLRPTMSGTSADRSPPAPLCITWKRVRAVFYDGSNLAAPAPVTYGSIHTSAKQSSKVNAHRNLFCSLGYVR